MILMKYGHWLIVVKRSVECGVSAESGVWSVESGQVGVAELTCLFTPLSVLS